MAITSRSRSGSFQISIYRSKKKNYMRITYRIYIKKCIQIKTLRILSIAEHNRISTHDRKKDKPLRLPLSALLMMITINDKNEMRNLPIRDIFTKFLDICAICEELNFIQYLDELRINKVKGK